MPALCEHLLVPLDFTQKNSAALEVAQNLALREGARVTLLHVVETINGDESSPETREELDSFYQRLKAKAAEKMESVARPLEESGIDVRQRVLIGRPLTEIVSQTHAMGIDLLVVSSHRIDWQEGARTWGTLSYQLSILSPCQVLLIK